MSAYNKWHVLYTMPKQEKKVADELSKRSFEVFLPLCKSVRQWSDRKKRILVPLFPNYVFVNTSDVKRIRIFEVPGVVRFLSTKGRVDTISPLEILLIRNILNNNPEVFQTNLQRGDRARIISGPFSGMEGEIEFINGSCRLSLRVQSLNRIVRFDIPTNSVEPIALSGKARVLRGSAFHCSRPNREGLKQRS